jgi:hypothetical protein
MEHAHSKHPHAKHPLAKHAHPAILTPEEEECLVKEAELAKLEGKLADAELDLATLHSDLKAFEDDYFRIVAPCLEEMDQLKADAEGARAARTQEDADPEAASCPSAPRENFCPSNELKSLFREVAKNIHPDLASNEDERRRRDDVMAKANAAYASGDQDQLRDLLSHWKADPAAVQGDDVVARLIRLIRMIARVKHRIHDVKATMKQVRQTDLYFLRQRAERANAEGRDLLMEMRADLEEQLKQQRGMVQEMQQKVQQKMQQDMQQRAGGPAIAY